MPSESKLANSSRWPSDAFTPILLALVVGVALQLQQTALWDRHIYEATLLVALVLIVLCAIKKVAVAHVGWCLALAWLSVGFASTGLRASWYQDHRLDPDLEGRDLVVVGIVSELPQFSDAGLRFRLSVESAQLQGQAIKVPRTMDVGWYAGVYPHAKEPQGLLRQPASLEAGERWQLVLRLKAPHGSSNPHGFDYELWAWEQGVHANAYVRASSQDPESINLGQTWTYPVAWARQWVRTRIMDAVPDRDRAGLLAALVVGEQAAIDRAQWDVYRATGVAHLVSISGLHITMFAWGATFLVGYLWRRSMRACSWLPASTAALLGGVVLAFGYAVFAGWGIPAQRTCVMLGAVAALKAFGLRWPWPVVWLSAFALVVGCDPWAMLQPGFWLSFVAVGVLFATDLGANSAGRTGAKAKVWSMLREQWVITTALAPLSVLLFGQLSLVSLAANAFAIPWVTLVITPLAMVGVIVPAVLPLASAAGLGLQLVLQFFAALPNAALAFPSPPLWLAVGGAIGAGMLVFPWHWTHRLLGLPLLAPVLLWQPALPPLGEFELLAADIGQGNAVLVRTATHALLFDAGPRYSLESDAGHRVLVPMLQSLGTRLNRVVLSHRDSDHVGGAAAVLAMQKQADLMSSIEREHPLQLQRPATPCIAGQQWVWDAVEFTVLHPQSGDYSKPLKPNAMSCVLRIRAAGSAPDKQRSRTALLVGDIENLQEARLVESEGLGLRADVLLVPHHGSKTSSSDVFLDAVQPTYALVQSGYRNRFGHPAAEVKLRYLSRGVTVLESSRCGAMTWRSWQAQNVLCQREVAKKYWHHQLNPPGDASSAPFLSAD
ncbi:DNA internalization-related competence protein ComEC/Rec2 [Rhodoferax aquaticus]|uniref:DNA internalization-related competence protein ComEC/Rec2 n=1 Tax=Rhodoferax aquaticus TaxID=2527691 RepID=A0A515EPB8_9BURK|nr:DNA internalization-related competence protein ComEC/Rec2 [Rhodoferax aquaticus]QDL54513.1 DNA internalization-related competence protein ComEC/Rec2 [Rhodoferax aquaticus]